MDELIQEGRGQTTNEEEEEGDVWKGRDTAWKPTYLEQQHV